jgi:hypothetical protein
MQPENYQNTRYGLSAGPPLESIITWIIECWTNLDSEMIKASYITCGINPIDYATNVSLYHTKLNSILAELLVRKRLPVSYIDCMTEEECAMQAQQVTCKVKPKKPDALQIPEDFCLPSK